VKREGHLLITDILQAMNELTAKNAIGRYFPNLEIHGISKIGEGLGNVAFEVNTDLIFRFPKKIENKVQLEHEISIQPLLKKYIELPVPLFSFIPPDHSFVGYKKLLGTPLLYKLSEFNNWTDFAKHIGQFISKLHAVSEVEYGNLHLLVENKTYDKWKQDGVRFYAQTKVFIPKNYHKSIESFFNTDAPKNKTNTVLCHNDLGIEHILVEDDKITGIIDFGGNALADRGCEFARLYRDLGDEKLDLIIDNYSANGINKLELRERAVYYGKCLLFEDLFYGAEQDIYRKKCISALGWMFS